MSARQPWRVAAGGGVDRARPLRFRFNGKTYEGYAGDTLASALLANGVHLVGRSFKYHRPRGIVGAGAEEPNALVQLETGARTEPNTRATLQPLYEGLSAASQNCWPSVGLDIGTVNDWASPLLPAGFYYKTFMRPRRLWTLYEWVIRHAAGMGRAPRAPDPDVYEHRHAHCDLLVVGGGPAGLAAARAAARAGARVMVAEQDHAWGGSLLAENSEAQGKELSAAGWLTDVLAELRAAPGVQLLKRTTAFGYFDHNALTLVQHLDEAAPGQPRQRLWKIRAKEVVLATGAIERPLVFGGNDRPGIMLASAARTYVNRYAVRPGSRAVIYTNNDSAYAAALDLRRAGLEVTLVDGRASAGERVSLAAAHAGITLHMSSVIVRTHGRARVTGVELASYTAGRVGPVHGVLECNVVCMSGGWNPTVHLHSQAQGRLRFDDALTAFVPGETPQSARSAGAVNGRYTIESCVAEGDEAGREAARRIGLNVPPPTTDAAPGRSSQPSGSPLLPLWQATGGARDKCFVDFQNDVTARDVALAAREGYVSVEHLKRYTTLGMGNDQGKLSNVNGLALLSQAVGAPIPKVGTTTFRAPYTPVTFGAMAGDGYGTHIAPLRRSAMHSWHERAGARFVNAGLWRRPQLYPRAGESEAQTVAREVHAVRNAVGLIDVSTLGKIDIKGRDAAELLERVYINRWKNLAVGKVRYGAMLRDDGVVLDDGTSARLAEHHYLMTTTTVNAVRVMSWLEYWLQVEWRDLEVYLTSVTDHWAAMALAGPRSREVLAALAPGSDVSAAALPSMGYLTCTIAGVPARVFRVSFSGELAYEINVPADYGLAVWEAALAAGAAHGITPYGTDAMNVLRIEKGHVTGLELDGRTTAGDLGLGGMIKNERDFLGARSLARPGMTDPERRQLVGLVPVDGATPIPRGAQLLAAPAQAPSLGHVTSTCHSSTLDKPIALALLSGGRGRIGTRLTATAPLAGVTLEVEVVSSVFHDPSGARARA